MVDIHFAALKYLLKKKKNIIINCGYEKERSVKQVIDVFSNISQKKINFVIKKKREGDISYSVSDSQRLKKKLNWKPKYDSLDEMAKSTYHWNLYLKKISML